MKVYELKKEQFLNISLDKAWDFFSSPKNLKEITPDYLGFKITSKNLEDKMYAGQIISYIVKPILGIPIRWTTEINHVDDKKYFVDTQIFGPYTLWHHKHFFEEHNDGVLMTDIVHYAMPLGFLGRIAQRLFVKNQLEAIFAYREQITEKLFNNDQNNV